MIESSFFPSIWESDLFQDNPGTACSSLFDIEDFSSEHDLENSSLSSCSTPIEFCSSSTDYENLLLDELEKVLPISDQFVSQILGETTSGLSDFDWLTDYPLQCTSSLKNNSSTGISLKLSSIEYLASSKLWSKMSTTEQLETLQALSEIVTYHMGIREQVEIIKIIDPTAIISPDDKEFALDSSYLNDSKLVKIKDFISKHKSVLPKSSSFQGIKKAENLSHSRTKRKQKKPKTIENTHLKKKRQKQTRKEKKSGFFVYEKKMKLSNPLEEDEDVNILE